MPVQTPKTVGIQSPWVVGSAGFSLEVGEGGRGGSRASPPLGGECPLGPQKGMWLLQGWSGNMAGTERGGCGGGEQRTTPGNQEFVVAPSHTH